MGAETESGLQFGVALLCAGRSTRMGRPKMLLPWANMTVLGHLIEQWRRYGARQIVVVCAVDASDLRAELDRLGFPDRDRVRNLDPDRGMFSSIQCAARWNGWDRSITHWVIALGDQPHLQPQTLKQLVKFGRAHPGSICQPTSNGRPRHPVWMPQTAFAALRECQHTDLKSFLEARGQEREFVEVHDPGLGLDLDTPEDYERLRRQE